MSQSKPTYASSPDVFALSGVRDTAARKSIVLDLAYEEYCQRLEAGQPPDPDEFCRRYPRFQTSLRRLIEVHRCIEENPPSRTLSPPVRWPEPGDSFLGFTIVEELGRGAFARVFLAKEPALGNREVAIKVSLEGAAEAKTLGRLEHPNIVPVHSVQKEELTGLNVVCMPYLGSATLCDVLDRAFAQPELPTRARVILEAAQGVARPVQSPAQTRTLSPWLLKGTYVEGIVHLATQLADALSFVHAKGIYHRDLKPSNILLTPDGTPMLLDFNLSFDKQRTEKRLGGTLPYMAPEHLQATDAEKGQELSKVDEHSDLFSLGVILYELLSGTHPFGPVSLKQSFREGRARLLERQKQGPRPLREVNRQVDRQLAQLIESCLAYDAANRPSGAKALVTVLRERLARVQRTRRLRTMLGVSVLVLVTGVTGVSLLHERHPFERGLEAYQQEKFERAVSWLNRAIQSQPTNARALYWRGRAHLRQGRVDVALDDFFSADKLWVDGRVKATIGYCLSRRAQHYPAIQYYLEAIDAQFATAELFNDLGYSYLITGQLDDAWHWLNKSIELEPDLQAGFYNRAKVHLTGAAGKKKRYTIDAGLADIEKALELGPKTADVYREAARLYAAAAERNGQRRDRALDYVQLALEEGQDPKQLQQDDFLRHLRCEPRFQGLVTDRRPRKAASKTSSLVDPVKNVFE